VATPRRRRRLFYVLSGAVALVLVVQLSGGVVASVRGAGNVVTAPVSWTLNLFARPIGHFFSGALNYSDVLEQNRQLRYQVGVAQTKANQVDALERQLRQLTDELNVPFVGSLATIAAPVTELSPTNFVASIGIGKGRNDGVMVGMPVVANGGVVGRVVSVSLHGATVQLVTDASTAIGCTYGDGTTNAIVSGRGLNHTLSVTAIPLKGTLAPGTVFATNGLDGGLYPAGLPVATVTSVKLTPGATTYDLRLQPVADVRNLHYVDVVVWEPAT
jgi:rod shape-determining protein MreC